MLNFRGNGISDKLAKESLSKQAADLTVLLGKGERYSGIKEKLEHQWQREWEKEQKGRHYFSHHHQ